MIKKPDEAKYLPSGYNTQDDVDLIPIHSGQDRCLYEIDNKNRENSPMVLLSVSQESEASHASVNIPNFQIFQSEEAVMGSHSAMAGSANNSGHHAQSEAYSNQEYLVSVSGPENPPDSPPSLSNSGSSDLCESQNFTQQIRKRKHTGSDVADSGGKRKREENGNQKKKNLSKEDEEKKKAQNRKYARTSRLKKANELTALKEEKLQQESIIEIYKKVLNIYHMRLNGANIRWKKHVKEWFPSQATRNSPPIQVECLLPDLDEGLLAEIGNSAYGTLFTSAEGNMDLLTTCAAEVRSPSISSSNTLRILKTGASLEDNESILQTDLEPRSSISSDSKHQRQFTGTDQSTITGTTDSRSHNLDSSSDGHLLQTGKSCVSNYSTLPTVVVPSSSVSSETYHPIPSTVTGQVQRTTEPSCSAKTSSSTAHVDPMSIKVENVDSNNLPPGTGEQYVNVRDASVEEQNLLDILSGARIQTSTGQQVNVLYVIPRTKLPQKTSETPRGAQVNISSSDTVKGTEITKTQLGFDKQVRVAINNEGLNEKQEQTQSLPGPSTSAGSYSHASISGRPGIPSQNFSSNDLRGKHCYKDLCSSLHVPDANGQILVANMHVPCNPSETESQAERPNRYASSFPILNTALNLSVSKKENHANGAGVKLNNAMVVDDCPVNVRHDMEPACQTRLTNLLSSYPNAEVTVPTSSTLQLGKDKSETHEKNKPIHSGKPLHQVIHMSHGLQALRPTHEHVAGKDNFTFMVKEPQEPRQPDLLTLSTRRERAAQDPGSYVVEISPLPQPAPISSQSGLGVTLRSSGQQQCPSAVSNAELKPGTPPDESQVYVQVYTTSGLGSLSTPSSSGLGSLSAFIDSECDNVELENLKPTFPNQT